MTALAPLLGDRTSGSHSAPGSKVRLWAGPLPGSCEPMGADLLSRCGWFPRSLWCAWAGRRIPRLVTSSPGFPHEGFPLCLVFGLGVHPESWMISPQDLQSHLPNIWFPNKVLPLGGWGSGME